ncbi:hypothetical protein [Methanocella paludicola]|nr:hypothetical protein [Methanocella paludicola]
MAKSTNYIVYAVLAIILIVLLCMTFSQVIAEKTLVDESITLSPGSSKTYNMPPGMVTLKFTSDIPVDEAHEGIGGSGQGHDITSGSAVLGTPLGVRYTITNTGSMDAHVHVRMTTGVLNPFGYL